MSRWTIAWRSIQQRGLASTLTGLSMALGVMLVVAVLVVHGVIDRSFLNNSGLGYNIVVGAKGGRLDLVLNTVYYLSRPVENIPYSYYLELTQGKYKDYVEKAIPVCLGDIYQEFRVIGTTSDFFDELDYGGRAYEFAVGRNFKDDEYYCAVIGATVARETGLKVGDEFQPAHGAADGHVHDPFKIVGVLKPTGTPNDRGLFINMEGFFLIPEHAKPVDEEPGDKPAAEHKHEHGDDEQGHEHAHEHAADAHEGHAHEGEGEAHQEHGKGHEHTEDPDHKHDAHADDDHDHDHAHEKEQSAGKKAAGPADRHEETDGDVREKNRDPDAMPVEEHDADDKDHDHADHEHADMPAAEGEHAHEEHDHAGHEHHDDHHHGHSHGPLPIEQREVTAVLVLTSSVPTGFMDKEGRPLRTPPEAMAPALIKMINKDSVAQAVQPIREMNVLFSTFVNPMQGVLLCLTVMIVIVSGIGILVSIYNSMNERQHEIAVMRALGAGRRTVMLLVLLESILLSLAGGLAGWLVGHVLIAALSPWIAVQTGVSIGFLQFVGYELVIIPGLIALASLVGYLPAMAAYRTDVAKALSATP